MSNVQQENEQARQQEEELHLHDKMAAESPEAAESAPQEEPSQPGARLALEDAAKNLPPAPVVQPEAAAPEPSQPEKKADTAPVAPDQAAEKARIELEDAAEDAPPAPEAVELERDLYRGKTERAEKPLEEKLRRLEDRPRPAKEERRHPPRTQRREDKYRRRESEPLTDEQMKAIGIGLLAVIGVVIVGREVTALFQLLSNWWALLILVPGIWALDKGYTPYRITGRLPRLSRQWLVGGFIATLIGLVGLFNMWYMLPLWIILSGAVIWWANKNR